MKEITNPNSVVWLPRKRKLIFFFCFGFSREPNENKLNIIIKLKKKNHAIFRRKKILGCVSVPERERESKRIEWRIASESGLVFLGRERERARPTFCLLRAKNNMGPSWLGRSTRYTRPSWVFEMRSHVWEECYNETMSNAMYIFWQVTTSELVV